MRCYQCQKRIKPPAAVCAVVANFAEWPRITVYFAPVEAGDPEPKRPVCDFYFVMCSPACTALWWSYVHQVMQDRLERHLAALKPEEVLRVH